MKKLKVLVKSSLITSIALIIAILSLGIVFAISKIEKPEKSYTIVVAHNPGFYQASFKTNLYLKDSSGKIIESDKDVEILYTVTNHNSRTSPKGEFTAETGEVYMFSGGKEPSYEGLEAYGVRQTFIYDDSIEITNPSKKLVRVVTIRAAIFINKEQVCKTQTFSYLIGTGSDEYSDLIGAMVITITTDEDNLYDYEKGIMIFGKTYDDTLINEPHRDLGDWWYPKNFHQRGIEWEREASINFYEIDGSLVLSQECGIRVSGGTSRNASIKSLKLVAREEYDTGKNNFYYDFFDNLYDHYGDKITKFKKLIIRNSVNDEGGSMIRDEFIGNLAAYVGVDHQEGRPCLVYLNGKFYSLMTLKNTVETDHIESLYKIPRGEIAMMAIQSNQFQFRYRIEQGEQKDFDGFIKDMTTLLRTNYKDKDISEIEKIIDVDNFIRYMAFQIYVVNPDWPHNNHISWKYTGVPKDSVLGMDGKWRFVLKDLDFGFRDPTRNMYDTVMSGGLFNNEPHAGQILRNLLKNPEFNRRFKEHMTKLCTEIMTEELVNSIILQSKESRLKDMPLYRFYFGGSDSSWYNLIDEFLAFTKVRNKYCLEQLNKLP